MAAEEPGDEVNDNNGYTVPDGGPLPPTCPHGEAVYYRQSQAIHTGLGTPCVDSPMSMASTEHIPRVTEDRPRKVADILKDEGITGSSYCGVNDVHTPHGTCGGVGTDGTGMFIRDGLPEPWPAYPQNFKHGVLEPYRKKLGQKLNSATPVVSSFGQPFQFGKTDEPVLGIHDDTGRSLVEFRIKDGRVEAKYYGGDLDEAARRFVEFLRGMKGSS